MIVKLTAREISIDPVKNLKILFTVLLEVIGRFLGWYDYKIRKLNPYKWDVATSTKDLSNNPKDQPLVEK